MAWIEDSAKGVLLVRQATGLKLWTLPGGKVKRGEALVKALKREVHEETGLHVQVGSLLGVLDRHDKDAITLLFAAIPTEQSSEIKEKKKRKSRKRAFKNFYLKKLRPLLNISGGAERLYQERADDSSFNTSVPDSRGIVDSGRKEAS